MSFHYCRKCVDMRQFLPDANDVKHCDICGNEL